METPFRKIIHIDMDAFFASIEQRDKPDLQGKPVIIGGSPESRGVVSTASYEARKYGIRSAMPTSEAYRRCPHGVYLSPDINRYKRVSNQIMGIFKKYTGIIEPMSIDEAFLDVTTSSRYYKYARDVAKDVLCDIYDSTGLTASAGVAQNKFLAKVASDMKKPAGLTVIAPEMVHEFLCKLPIRKVPGIGKVTEQKLITSNIHTMGDLLKLQIIELQKIFGSRSQFYYDLARGVDNRRVSPREGRKSLSAEDTFAEDYTDLEFLNERISELSKKVYERCDKGSFFGKTVTLKITYSDFTKVTRGKTLSRQADSSDIICENASKLLKNTEAGTRPIRLIGICISNAGRKEVDSTQQVLPGF